MQPAARAFFGGFRVAAPALQRAEALPQGSGARELIEAAWLDLREMSKRIVGFGPNPAV